MTVHLRALAASTAAAAMGLTLGLVVRDWPGFIDWVITRRSVAG
ncbi:MAG TPA: hypothetical protein VFK66_08490 [Oryzihumus sp.]|nr:hypothetical protein [Oryzihumus sp.]